MTILLNILVPACAVLLLLIVTTVIAIVYVRKRRRQNRTVKSMDRFEMMARNPLYMEAGMVEYHCQVQKTFYPIPDCMRIGIVAY